MNLLGGRDSEKKRGKGKEEPVYNNVRRHTVNDETERTRKGADDRTERRQLRYG